MANADTQAKSRTSITAKQFASGGCHSTVGVQHIYIFAIVCALCQRLIRQQPRESMSMLTKLKRIGSDSTLKPKGAVSVLLLSCQTLTTADLAAVQPATVTPCSQCQVLQELTGPEARSK